MQGRLVHGYSHTGYYLQLQRKDGPTIQLRDRSGAGTVSVCVARGASRLGKPWVIASVLDRHSGCMHALGPRRPRHASHLMRQPTPVLYCHGRKDPSIHGVGGDEGDWLPTMSRTQTRRNVSFWLLHCICVSMRCSRAILCTVSVLHMYYYWRGSELL